MFKQHPGYGKDILDPIKFLHPLIPGVHLHHERWDGRGYPLGLKGNDVPLIARIIAVADTYDAMTSDRAYRRALPHEVAVGEIERCCGSQFDPEIVALVHQRPRRLPRGAGVEREEGPGLRKKRACPDVKRHSRRAGRSSRRDDRHSLAARRSPRDVKRSVLDVKRHSLDVKRSWPSMTRGSPRVERSWSRVVRACRREERSWSRLCRSSLRQERSWSRLCRIPSAQGRASSPVNAIPSSGPRASGEEARVTRRHESDCPSLKRTTPRGKGITGREHRVTGRETRSTGSKTRPACREGRSSGEKLAVVARKSAFLARRFALLRAGLEGRRAWKPPRGEALEELVQ